MLLHNYSNLNRRSPRFRLCLRSSLLVNPGYWLRTCLCLSLGLVAGNGHSQTSASDQVSSAAAIQPAQMTEFSAQAQPPLDAEDLLAGEVILRFTSMNDEVQRVQGWVLIDAERTLVWSLLVDCQQALEYVPNMRACEVRDSGIAEDGHAFDLTYHRVKPYFFLPAVENLFRADYLPPEQIRFRKAGGDLVHFQGSWQFHASAEQQTLLQYDAEVDLRASVNVRGERRMIRKDVGEMLARLKHLSEHHADKPEQHR